jgi:hypothetical protein
MQLSSFHIVFILCQMAHTTAVEDAVLDIPEGSVDCGRGHGQAPRGNPRPPPLCPPVSIEQLLATQNEIMSVLKENEARRGAGRRITSTSRTCTCPILLFSDSPAIFSRAKDPLEENDWCNTHFLQEIFLST